jgi:phasin family protein
MDSEVVNYSGPIAQFTKGNVMINLFPTAFPTPPQSQGDTPNAPWVNLLSKTLENSVKLAELNVWMMKESTELSQRFLQAKTPSELFALSAQALPHFEKALSYANQLGGIGAGMQAELNKTVQAGEGSRESSPPKRNEAVASNPAGDLLSMMNSAIENASAGYVQWLSMAKQAGGAMGLPLPSPVEQYTAAAKTAVERARKVDSAA